MANEPHIPSRGVHQWISVPFRDIDVSLAMAVANRLEDGTFRNALINMIRAQETEIPVLDLNTIGVQETQVLDLTTECPGEDLKTDNPIDLTTPEAVIKPRVKVSKHFALGKSWKYPKTLRQHVQEALAGRGRVGSLWTIGEIHEYMEKRYSQSFNGSSVYVTLLTLTHEGRVTRERVDGQFMYAMKSRHLKVHP